MKYGSMSLGQDACLEGMLRTITMQGFNLAAITGAEKNITTTLHRSSQWTMKYRSRVSGQGKA